MFAGFFLTFRRLSEVAGGYDVHCLIGLRHEHVRTVRGKGAGCLRLSSGCEGSQKHGFRVLLSFLPLGARKRSYIRTRHSL